MIVNKFTPMHKILIAYPQLIDRLIERNEHFRFLRSNLTTTDTKYYATVSVVATVCKEDADELLDFIKKEIEKIDIQYRY